MTYDGFSHAWPSVGGEFGDKMNSMPKHVASTTLRDPQWNATLSYDQNSSKWYVSSW